MATGRRGNAQAGEPSVRRWQGCASARRPGRALALLGGLLAIAGATGTGDARAAPGDTLGVYAGAGNLDGVTSFEARLGRRVARVHDFLDKRSWASMLDLSWITERWRGGGFADRLVLTVPMIPDDGGTLAAGAAGQYNAHFRRLAEELVARGHGSAVLRLGPEFNGNWFAWTMHVPNGGALFATYWRQIVSTMRGVPGASFKFDWCANAGSSWIGGGQQLEAAEAWPGDGYVDYVGLDVYDQSWAPHRADPVARWNEYVNQRNGMAWHAAFAAAHGKPMTFPEWALADRADGMGGGDSPYFVEQMYRWIERHPVAYHIYFNSSDPNAEYALFSGRFPTAASRFVQYFGPNAPSPTAAPAPPAPAAPTHGGAPAGAAGTGAGAGSGTYRGGSRWPAGDTLRRDSLSRDHVARADPAKLRISRARILRREAQLDILAPITRRASGVASVVLHSAGKRTRFEGVVDAARGRVRVRKPISRAQAAKGTGIVTLTYAGDADTQPQKVRLRAAARKARLALRRPRLVDGRLRAEGTISSRARGRVRTQLLYAVGAASVVRQYSAPIDDGHWKLDVALAPSVLAEIDRREGTLQSSTLFTGYLPARIGGEMRAFQVLGK
ncbi:MAG TPA: glycosyl hydrolase [Solirubrobacteraceae bacterium]|nr:glycosyl hydrolase [Solirubrobacteraceae bacterium]